MCQQPAAICDGTSVCRAQMNESQKFSQISNNKPAKVI
jgi:hypothetical protein